MRHLVLLVYLFSATALGAPTIAIDKEKSSVEFLAIGRPSALKIRGTQAKPEGKISFNDSGPEGAILLNLDEFVTGIALRDRHMKEKYLETGKEEFKTAKLLFQSISLPKEFWKSPSPQKVNFQGKLRLHGVEKDVSGEMDITSASKEALRGQAKFSIVLTDFGISIPSFSGITVADKVEVEVSYVGKVENL